MSLDVVLIVIAQFVRNIIVELHLLNGIAKRLAQGRRPLQDLLALLVVKLLPQLRHALQLLLVFGGLPFVDRLVRMKCSALAPIEFRENPAAIVF